VHEIRSGAEGAGLLKPAVVRADYEFRCPDRLGSIDHGGGALQSWLGLQETLSDPRAILLVNRRPELCRWRARLLFPRPDADLREGSPDDIPGTLEPDPRFHLSTRLIGPEGRKSREAGWTLAGTLNSGEEVELGIESKLPRPAREAAEGEQAHPALDTDSAVILELELEWVDERGEVVGRRALRVPVTISTRHWLKNPKPWILGGAALVGLALLGRMLVRRRRGKTLSVPAPVPTATAEPPPAPRPYPRLAGGDEGTPEHMR
jgi:hypothetical protein